MKKLSGISSVAALTNWKIVQYMKLRWLTCLLKPQVKQYVGKIVIADIGIPKQIPEYIC